MLTNRIIKVLIIKKYIIFKKFIGIDLIKDKEFTLNNKEDLIELENINWEGNIEMNL